MIDVLLAGAAGVAVAAALMEFRPKRRRGSLLPLVAKLGRTIGLRPANGLAARVAAAGLDRPTSDVVALQAGLALLFGLASLPLIGAAPGRLGIALVLAAPALGYLLPEWGLRRRAARRARAVEAELPDVLDLLRVAIGAGLAPRRALKEVGRRHPGTLAAELTRAVSRSDLGEPVERALDGLELRCPPTAAFVAVLRRAERHGAPLATALAAQALQARARRAAQRSEAAAKAAPKIQLIVALLLVPAVLLLVAAALVPALAG